MVNNQSDIGLIGLAVMGQNLALNIADHGFQISVFNRTPSTTQAFVEEHPNTPGGLQGHDRLESFIQSLKSPRKIIILVQAGQATDAVIKELIPLLDQGDIVIDGGNARWTDTIRREKELTAQGLQFIGSGVSGGEEGARFGPALMPGGSIEAWEYLKPIWEAIAAKIDETTGQELKGAKPGEPVEGGVPCTTYIGPNGAGHYVKMVHNGIEYGDMQMICEAYDLMRHVLGLTPVEMGDIFARWNQGRLNSFLIEITADILKQADPDTQAPFVDIVLDTAGQKGTGKWTSTDALDMGVPAPTIAEAVFARCMSAIKAERVQAAEILPPRPQVSYQGDPASFIDAIEDALYCSKVCSYAQGFQQMRYAEQEYDWTLNLAQIAQVFRGGCIIRAGFLQKITEAFERDNQLVNLLLDPYFCDQLAQAESSWRQVVSTAIMNAVPVPTFASSLAYYDAYRSKRLPQNLLQAQRDYFGAHTYERTDKPRGEFYHLDWPTPDRSQRKV